MGFELKEKLKQMLPKYLEILEDRGLTEERGNGYWNCPFCHSGDKVKNTPAFHLTNNNTKYSCFSCGAKGDIFDLVEHMEGMKNTIRHEILHYLLWCIAPLRKINEDDSGIFHYFCKIYDAHAYKEMDENNTKAFNMLQECSKEEVNDFLKYLLSNKTSECNLEGRNYL